MHQSQQNSPTYAKEANKKIAEIAYIQEATDEELGLDSLPKMDRDAARSELIVQKQQEQRLLREQEFGTAGA